LESLLWGESRAGVCEKSSADGCPFVPRITALSGLGRLPAKFQLKSFLMEPVRPSAFVGEGPCWRDRTETSKSSLRSVSFSEIEETTEDPLFRALLSFLSA